MSFEEFWKAYPRKVGKGAARLSFQKALKKAPFYEIMAGLERFIAAEPWKGDLQYCCHPKTWLMQERWEDEYEAPQEHGSLRRLRLEAKVNKNLWLPSWGEEPTIEQARQELGRGQLRLVK